MGAFVADCERLAVGGEKFRVGEEAADHGDDALVEGEDGAESFAEILLRRGLADGLLQGAEWDEHVRKALFEDGQEQLETVLKVDVDGGF